MFKKALKRMVDVTVSLLLLLLISPFLIPLIIVLAFTGEGDVFFTQKRIGYKNHFFKIWKFTTMYKGSEKKGTITVRNDPRVTPIGGFLRKTKLNELPQLFNVLLGDMSLVGPRPQGIFEFDAYSKQVQKEIYNCRPGITGIGSIIFRDEEKFLSTVNVDPKEYYKEVIAPYKGEVELWYNKHQTFFVDLKIMILTLWVVIYPDDDIIYSVFRSLPKFQPNFVGVK